jgi:hypothetical protein
MFVNILRVCLFPLAAMVMNTLNIGLHDWQYWAILLIMFGLSILTYISAQHRVQPTPLSLSSAETLGDSSRRR